VANDDFHDATLILLGHGSTVNTESEKPAQRLAEELGRRRLFAEVRVAFWARDPRLQAVVTNGKGPRIFVMPLFTGEGYLTEEAIPRVLGLVRAGQTGFDRVQRRGGRTLHYCRPVGCHESMTEVLLDRARHVVDAHPFPRRPKTSEIALFLAGHGTARHPNSRKIVERQGEIIRARGDYAEVHAVFLEEEPRVGNCPALTRLRYMVLVPFFISDGLHAGEEIPILLGEPEAKVRERMARGQPAWRNPTERRNKLIWYAAGVGAEPRLLDVILEGVREMARLAPTP
jgi:sirohydrochlorin cobaltochelatase